MSVSAAIHGTRAEYRAGCRCDECSEANRVYARRYDHHRTPSIFRPGDRQATFGTGRKCRGCPTILSRYTPEPWCTPCHRKRFEKELDAIKAREDREVEREAERARRLETKREIAALIAVEPYPFTVKELNHFNVPLGRKPRHGTRYGHNVGCRCDDCVAANRAYRRALRVSAARRKWAS